MERKEIDDIILLIEDIEATADFIDPLKSGEDMTFLEAHALVTNYKRTGDLFELIRLVYDLGFFRGVTWKLNRPGTTWEEVTEKA